MRCLRTIIPVVSVCLLLFSTHRVFAASASLSKSIQTDFDAGTYSQSSYRTIDTVSGVQLNGGGGEDGTQYKRPIEIDNTGYASTLTDYVIDVTIDTQALIAAGKLQADCGDIRVRDSDDTTAIENIEITDCDSATTTISIKVPSIPASDSKTIYLYYGALTDLDTQSSPQSNSYIDEDMQSAPTGTLKGSPVATYDADDEYVELTTPSGGWGALEYSANPGTDFDATFEFWAGGGTGADATYFYVYSTSTPQHEGADSGGYMIYFSEFQSSIGLRYQSGGNLATAVQANMGNSAWHTARIVKSGLNFKVYYDGVEKINFTDSSRTITGTLMGYGARTGGLTNYHRIRNLSVVGASPSPIPTTTVESESEALYTTGSWTSPAGNDAYELSTITDWGDGTDDSAAFTSVIANVSADETVEFQMKSASTLDLLTAASFTSIGTANAGTTFIRSKSQLIDLGIASEEYIQVKTILSQSTNSSPAVQSFTISYTDATNDGSVSSSPTQSIHSSTPACTNAAPITAPDLFQIDATETSATLYFVPSSGDVTGYTIEYGQTSDSNQYAVSFDHDDKSGAVPFTINSLSPNTTWHFRVKAQNGCATGDWSQTKSTYTGTLIVASQEPDDEIVQTTDTSAPTAAPIQKVTITPTESVQREEQKEIVYDITLKVMHEGKPLVNAEVELHSDVQRAKTNNEGIAVFKEVVKGIHTLKIVKDAYAAEEKLTVEGDDQQYDVAINVQMKKELLPTWGWIAIIAGLFLTYHIVLSLKRHRQ